MALVLPFNYFVWAAFGAAFLAIIGVFRVIAGTEGWILDETLWDWSNVGRATWYCFASTLEKGGMKCYQLGPNTLSTF